MFWCVEAVFESISGVKDGTPKSYSGGYTAKSRLPRGLHRQNSATLEVVQCFVYDPTIVTLSDILMSSFGTHDPTTLNRQVQICSQYRSAIFYHSDEHLSEIEAAIGPR